MLRNPALGCSGVILLVTAAYLACGMAAFAGWRITGKDVWVEEYFQVPAALAMVWLAAVELWLAVRALRQFEPGEMMHRAWYLIALAAFCDLAGAVSVQVFAARSPLNPLRREASATLLQNWHYGGQVIGGTMRFALLAVGLYHALRVYRRSGFLGKVKPADWAVLAAFGAYLAVVVYELVVAFGAGKPFQWREAAGWPVDPLLCLLLFEAALLYRSVERMGGGWIGRCWKAYSVGILLTALGDIGTWAFSYGYLPYPWSSVIWYLWLPAAAAFALAPAYQLEAIHHAGAADGRY